MVLTVGGGGRAGSLCDASGVELGAELDEGLDVVCGLDAAAPAGTTRRSGQETGGGHSGDGTFAAADA